MANRVIQRKGGAMSNTVMSGSAKLWFAPIGTEIPSNDQSFDEAGWVEYGAIYTAPVGLQLSYSLRDLHRNFARYGQWPNTN
jgi:hypothetical protein